MGDHDPTPAGEISQRIAAVMIEGFDRHYWLFRETSAAAKHRFEVAAWPEAQQAVRERIRYYDERVEECVERLRDELDAGSLDDAIWRSAKLLYNGLLVDHKRPELAETFFNSVVTRVLQRTYVHNDFAFVRAAVSTEYIESDPPIYRSYYPAEVGLRNSLLDIFSFGRRAGIRAAEGSGKPLKGRSGIGHVYEWQRQLTAAGLPLDVRGPLLFPSYGNFDLRLDANLRPARTSARALA